MSTDPDDPTEPPSPPPAADSGWGWRVFLALLAVAFLWVIVRPLLAPLVLGCAAAVILLPLHRRLERRWGEGSNRGALVSVVAFTLFAGVPLLAAILLFTLQAGRVLEELIGLSEGEPISSGLIRLVDQHLDWLEALEARYLGDTVDLRGLAEEQLLDFGSRAYEGLIELAEWLGRMALSWIVFLLVLFFLLRDGRELVRLLRESSPLGGRHLDQILERLGDTIRAVFLGALLTAALQASLGALGFVLAGFENFMIWGVFLFVASFVPVVGSALVWGPAVLYLATSGAQGAALLLLVFGLVISTSDNVLRVVLIGRQTTLHPLLLFLAVFGGLATAGPMGLFYGLLLAAAGVEATDIYREQRAQERANETG